MRLWSSILRGLLLTSQAAQVSTSSIHEAGFLSSNFLRTRGEDIEAHLRQHANDRIRSMQRRQTPSAIAGAPGPSLSPASGDASNFDLNAWQAQTQAACMNSIAALNGQASNPSGMAVCYNLPFLDNSTGVFQAELRLYNVSAPVDTWKGVTENDISLELAYTGATVQATNDTFAKRDTTLSWPPVRARLVLKHVATTKLEARQDASSTKELQVLNYVGRVNANLLGSAMSNPRLQQFLVPTIRLTATSPSTNEQVNTVLSSSEASFVNGVFSQAAVSSPDSAAQASASAAAAIPFVLPGVTFGIFPVGFIITMSWTVLFVAVVGYGTWGRYQFREHYRRRVKRDQAIALNNI
ncbi:hypothetical protein EJ05DRAFT_497002 [Pseudovirgaria hyperparasitica]|uniref:Uncharacterized protein n=1 Tax=Pseudovirgaria hyperparasitica TaxID=470096 RepID=A0A6A6WIY3_9PEZI|nr:uncharacterized protein EJ05DRAFT_497002 [Pseudovirgaria hyperparasitica]KAF2762134.1 hypothetical protein EJ05DRAFT_497002 [Pseudovirgaria hyperparasitica]